MSFTGFCFPLGAIPDREGCRAPAIVGKGRMARDDGNDEFRFGTILCGTDELHEDEEGEPARGEETLGRDMVIYEAV